MGYVDVASPEGAEAMIRAGEGRLAAPFERPGELPRAVAIEDGPEAPEFVADRRRRISNSPGPRRVAGRIPSIKAADRHGAALGGVRRAIGPLDPIL